MKSSRLLLLSVLLLACAVCACKKDDEETLYLNGYIKLTVDKYVEAGYTKTFNVDTLMKVTLDDGSTEGIGYAVVLPPGSARDTIKTKTGDFKTKTFTVVAPDSLSTFGVMVIAFADGYYESSQSATFTVVKSGINGKRTTLSGYDIRDTDLKFTDERDGQEYYYTEKGDLQWMRQNLSWAGSGMAFENSPSGEVNAIFGRYYTWTDAQTACPDGWRLPTDKDWCDLASYCGLNPVEGKDIYGFSGMIMENIYFNRSRMWEYWPGVKIDNAAGLSVAPFGYATVEEDTFSFTGMNKYAVFWTANETEGLGVNRYIYDDKNILFYGTSDKDCFSASVRCVRDVPPTL